MMKRFKVELSGAARGRLFHLVALALACMVTSQTLPVTLTGNDFIPDHGEETSVFSLQPIQVCNSVSDFSGFLADHPWVSAQGIVPLYAGTGTAHVLPPESGLPEGVPPAVFRPPRTVLS